MSLKSYIEPKDLPTDGFSNLAAALKVMKYGDIKDEEKPDVIVVKESFFLRNERGNKIGVFTRSAKDHSATIGDCRVLVNNDFMVGEAAIHNHGKICYDVSDRLHEHLGSYSSLFSPASTDKSVLLHLRNPINNRRYIFAVFEMICTDFPPPLYIKLKTRREDAFVGFHDVKDVSLGIKKYNVSSTEVDDSLMRLMKQKRFFDLAKSSVFGAEIKNAAFSSNLTIFKVNLFGVG